MKLLLSIFAIACFTACTASQSEGNTNNETAQQGSEMSAIQGEDFVDLGPASFSEKMKSNPGTILDVRTPEEIAEGKIEGAVTMNFYEDNFKASVATLDKTKPVYVYCAAGGRSAKASTMLKSQGFKEVYNLDGGMTAWLDEAMPIVK
jgi:phage shock protein E